LAHRHDLAYSLYRRTFLLDPPVWYPRSPYLALVHLDVLQAADGADHHRSVPAHICEDQLFRAMILGMVQSVVLLMVLPPSSTQNSRLLLGPSQILYQQDLGHDDVLQMGGIFWPPFGRRALLSASSLGLEFDEEAVVY
jgi:hypothetical protein